MADFLRQLDIISPEKLVYPITMIGLGGIGSFTAETLRKMGFKNFTLYDHDIVEAHNVPCQNYGYEEISMPKVGATAKHLRECLDTEAVIEVHRERFDAGPLEGIVIAGVDTMFARKAIWSAIRASSAFIPLYIDGRIGIEWDEKEKKIMGEWIEVFTVNPVSLSDIELYEQRLFDDNEGLRLHCTAQAVIYVGNFIAGFIASNIKKWISKEPFPRHLLYDVLTLDLVSALL